MDELNSQNPLISIVIPTYNAGDYILEAIESVTSQTYSPIELIIIDDGSTDNTKELLNKKNITFISQENAGQSAALNFGWKQSSGEILGYLSADDRLHPEAVRTIVSKFLINPDVVLVYPDFCIIDKHSNTLQTISTPNYDQKLLIAHFNCLPGPGALFRRKAWQNAGDWNIKLRQVPDIDFFFRLSKEGSFLRIDKPLADFRIHSKSTTYSASSPQRANEPIEVVKSFFDSQENLSPLRHWQKEATANALILSGFMHGYSGRYSLFFSQLIKAALIKPKSMLTKKTLIFLCKISKKFLTNRVKGDRNGH